MQQIVFLGIFDTIASWIMSGITKVLTWLVSNVIAPVCSFVWNNILSYVLTAVAEIVGVLVYKLYAIVLSLLYTLEQGIYAMAGATDVQYGSSKGNLLSLIFAQDAVKNAFWLITMMSITLCFVFTIYAVTTNTLDFSYDGRKSVGTILTNFLKSAITFLILPVFCYGLIQLTSICTTALHKATTISGTGSLTDSLYLLSVQSSITAENYNGLQKAMQGQQMLWYTFSNVKTYLESTTNVDYIIGFIGAIAVIINLVSMGAVFIQRILEVIILYIVSPFFTATMPLDDGERFNKWRSAFLGRLCMGISMIVALNIVMMVLGFVLTGSNGVTIEFTSTPSYQEDVVGYAAGTSVTIILKLIFIVGSLISVKTIGSTVTGIIDQSAAGAERSAANDFKGFARSAMAAPRMMVGAAKWADAKSNQYRQQKAMSESRKLGFSTTASSEDREFAKQLKSKAETNRTKSLFTRAGERNAAFSRASEKAQEDLKTFTSLSPRERAEFKKNYNMDSLNVDGSKYKSGSMLSANHFVSRSMLDINMDKIKNDIKGVEEGSAEHKAMSECLQSFKNIRNAFDVLNTDGEREAFINSHQDFFARKEGLNSEGAFAAGKLRKSVAAAKEKRDKHEEGSPAWKAADKKYNDLVKKSVQFGALNTNQERHSWLAANGFVPGAERFDELTESEADFSNQITSSIQAITEFAKDPANADISDDDMLKLTSAASYLEKAGADYNRMNTGSRRESFGVNVIQNVSGMLSGVKGFNPDMVPKMKAEPLSDREQTFEANLRSRNENDFSQQLSHTGKMINEYLENPELFDISDNSMIKLMSASSYLEKASQEYNNMPSGEEKEAFAANMSKTLAKRLSGNEELSDIPVPTMRSGATGLKNMTRRDRDNFVVSNVLSSKGEGALPPSECSKAENIFFSKNKDGSYGMISEDKQYERTADFAARYATADTAEDRQDILNDYYEYTRNAPNSERPGNWNRITNSPLPEVKGFNSNAAPATKTAPVGSDAAPAIKTAPLSSREQAFEARLNSRSENDFSQQLSRTGSIINEYIANPALYDISDDSLASLRTAAAYIERASQDYNNMPSGEEKAAFAAKMTSALSARLSVNEDLSDIPVPTMKSETVGFRDMTPRDRNNFVVSNVLSSQGQGALLPSECSRAEDIFFSKNEDGSYGMISEDKQYERTADYAARYATADTAIDRQAVLDDYNQYVKTAPEAERPGRWNSTADNSQVEDPGQKRRRELVGQMKQDRENRLRGNRRKNNN